MIRIHLHGVLKNLIRKSRQDKLELDVHSPAEALRALCAVLPGFDKIIRCGEWRITADTEILSSRTATLPFGARQSLHIYPAAVGAADPVTAGWIIAGLVAGVAVAAVLQSPKIGDYSERDRPEERNSYLFNGGVNSQEQGGIVPLIFGGPIRVGSVVVSAGVTSERVV